MSSLSRRKRSVVPADEKSSNREDGLFLQQKMINCCGLSKALTPEAIRSNEIDKQLANEKQIYRLTHRLLLLGAGESGKSTIIKQMQIINADGFNYETRKSYIRDIYINVRDSMVSLIKAMKSLCPPIIFEDECNILTAQKILILADRDEMCFTNDFFNDCSKLWQTVAVQNCYQRSNEFHLIDSAKYFLDRLSVLQSSDFLPSDQDILRCRVLTSQILQIEFKVKDAIFCMFDVGGQRDQRRKWIQCFNNVTAIVFVTSLSSYNLFLREDESKNRLQESLDLFQQLWQNRFLAQISVILFLNKCDILLEKVKSKTFNLGDYFPAFNEYKPLNAAKETQPDEPLEYTRARLFLRDKFLSLTLNSRSSDKLCFPHFTCAVDTTLMRKIFEDCRIMIQRMHLIRLGISLE